MKPAAPWSDIGQLQGELDAVKSQLHGKANTYELSTLSSRVDRMESTLWEISTTLASIRIELSGLQESVGSF